jgi:fibronectin type 3 domain-containing protein
LNVTFAPSASGTLNGSVTVTSNATNPTVTISLSGTAVQPASHSVALNLTPNSSNVVGYNLYRSSTSNGPYTKLNSPLVTSTTYTDTAVIASQTYFYVGTSVDSSGNETAFSNQVPATIPTP